VRKCSWLISPRVRNQPAVWGVHQVAGDGSAGSLHQAQLGGLKGGLARALGQQASALQGACDAAVTVAGGVAPMQRAL